MCAAEQLHRKPVCLEGRKEGREEAESRIERRKRMETVKGGEKK